ncbi:MAG: 2OG-Fe(II) oxygenase [Candidatus Sericytochromatia bacterium]
MWPFHSPISQQFSEALPSAELAALQAEIRDSAYLQRNVLNARFASTQGFSVIFRDPAPLLAHFPAMAPFVRQLPPASLYYLNALVLAEAGRVDRHIDHSIRGYDSSLPFPQRVSVLYVQVPEMEGGELMLYDRRDRLVQTLQPRTNLLVHFDGWRKHAVGAITHSRELRISLVCEQYRLSREQLESVPVFTIKSTAGFAAFLKEQQC